MVTIHIQSHIDYITKKYHKSSLLQRKIIIFFTLKVNLWQNFREKIAERTPIPYLLVYKTNCAERYTDLKSQNADIG